MGAVTEPTAAPDAAPSPSDDEQLPEQMRVRREKLDRLLAAGVEPYALGYARTTTVAELRAKYAD
ncbi:MAG: lysX, partial [Frankiales bacterium]|nr:lysX [Frankiales bacterium]